MSQEIFTSNWAVVLGALACLLALYRLSRKQRIAKGLRLPPGPPGKLIFGNASDIPTEQEWDTFAKWAEEYGDLVHLKILNTHMIWVNSAEVAHELFEKRSTLYSDRFLVPMLNDLMGFDWNFTMMPYGEKWRRHRKTFNQCFHPAAVVSYHDVQTRATRKFLKKLHNSPDRFIGHIRHHSGAIIMEILYGIQVLPEDDPYVQTAELAMSNLAEGGKPGAWMVDTFPILKHVPAWMPGAGFQKKARAWRVPIIEMPTKPFEFVKKSLAAGTAQPSFVTSLLDDLSRSDDDPGRSEQEEVIRDTAGAAYLGGADTTVSALESFVLAMVLYPEVQRKAQEELDRVVGNRLPVFEDREDLPYANALVKEVLRWHPATPLTTPHRVTQDDVYGDYFIPGGSLLLGNIWLINRDEKIFGPETEKFKPERFLKPGVRDPFTFGFGRRICPGRYLADRSVFIGVTSVLKAFDIAHARDKNGKEIFVKEAYTSGAMSHPEPFQCSITPRAGTEGLLAGLSD